MSKANFRREMISKKDFNQTEEKIGAQSSNAKSERQREFDNNNNTKGQNLRFVTRPTLSRDHLQSI